VQSNQSKTLLNKEHPIYKTVIMMSQLPQKEQERVASRLEGYIDGYERANRNPKPTPTHSADAIQMTLSPSGG